LDYLGDKEVGRITSTQVLEFLNYLRSEYVPRRIAGDECKLSDKTVYDSTSAYQPSSPGQAWNSRWPTR
jgi:hypothetical protein